MTQPTEPVNPPVWMAWHDGGVHVQFHHDPAPSLAEKARVGGYLGETVGEWVGVPAREYAAMLAVVQAARALVDAEKRRIAPEVVAWVKDYVQAMRDLVTAVDTLPAEEAH